MASVRYRLVLLSLLAWQFFGMEAKLMQTQPMVASTTSAKPVHIVYMGGISDMTRTNHEDFHKGMLQQALGSVDAASSSHLYSYTKSFNGFAASISPYHADMIRGMDGVVSVFESQTKHVLTTHSWEYLGLNPTQGVWLQSDFGNGTIVGLVDTGIWPEAESFNDDGFGPIPSKWGGSCVSGDNFTAALCNKKLIGAKYYYKGFEANGGSVAPGEKSPRDYEGHGTHTSSTSTGRQVPNASVNGLANGTASGGAPSARVAMYKACWGGACYDADILAAMEDAIADGVDVLSLSLGASHARDYILDVIAIGAFHATEKGVVVTCAAGNSGGYAYATVVNSAPWIFTIAASTQNRVLDPVLALSSAEGQVQLVMQGLNTLNALATNASYPIIYTTDIFNLNASDAAGNIIAIEASGVYYDIDALSLNATGVVAFTSTDQSVQLLIPVLPYVQVDEQIGTEIVNFINTTTRDINHVQELPIFGWQTHRPVTMSEEAGYCSNASAFISVADSFYNTTQTPINAWFSSIGPNVITPQILKPDISAPGVDILAAWTPADITSLAKDFNIISGTSMATPHAAGTAALVKSLHPDWSPAAIKSAIMTTATPFRPLNRSSSFGNLTFAGNSPIATGVGQINPANAADPGLVFNITTADYVNFLCGMGYNASSVKLMTGDNSTCTELHFTALDLNYPSIFLSSNFTVGVPQIIERKVINVGPSLGPGPILYNITAESFPVELNVTVYPTALQFASVDEEQSFNVSVTVTAPLSDYYFGYFTFSDFLGHVVTVTVGAGLPAPAPQ